MCLKTADGDRFQDFVAPCQNRSDKGRPVHFAVAIPPFWNYHKVLLLVVGHAPHLRKIRDELQ
jgi:hypothetical protein